ncbi:MAG: uracil-DNA glycosylase [Planctomycetes bacterium]|nr:uracil-DNA glycosylase [Planctomycetota bacterium]
MNDNRRAILHRRALQTIESLAAAGVQQLPKPALSLSPEGLAEPVQLGDEAAPPSPVAPMATEAVMPEKETVSVVSSAATLEVLCDEVAQCQLCPELASTRTQTVFGVGNSKARLCFLGEAPGGDEDRLGEPFVGKAGQLLNRILAACQLAREDVYILNVLKCRPPGNRNPTPEESQHCRRFLDRQLQLIQPEFICCLGAVAAQNLLDTTTSIGRLRGRFHEYQGIQVLCTYHPAYLLRNPSAKKDTWEDMKLLMQKMGIPLG